MGAEGHVQSAVPAVLSEKPKSAPGKLRAPGKPKSSRNNKMLETSFPLGHAP
ncbi:hypothetical protein HPP92_021526 [Vanilla planifolia]|uniref:Uncharacterized protein n=1 Tax=Vanilla planifolia TaxID=51239 RepID=A0A835UFL1_VANPL|nr:hypothetical protein HPP92_021526 [Vanilla planifolia]